MTEDDIILIATLGFYAVMGIACWFGITHHNGVKVTKAQSFLAMIGLGIFSALGGEVLANATELGFESYMIVASAFMGILGYFYGLVLGRFMNYMGWKPHAAWFAFIPLVYLCMLFCTPADKKLAKLQADPKTATL